MKTHSAASTWSSGCRSIGATARQATPGRRSFWSIASAELTRRAGQVFPGEYVFARTGLRVPDRRITDEGLAFLAGRRPADGSDLWTTLESLLQPGELAVWPPGHEDQGFRDLLELMAALDAADRPRSESLIAGLRGNPAARLLPVLTASGGRLLLPIPDPRRASQETAARW